MPYVGSAGGRPGAHKGARAAGPESDLCEGWLVKPGLRRAHAKSELGKGPAKSRKLKRIKNKNMSRYLKIKREGRQAGGSRPGVPGAGRVLCIAVLRIGHPQPAIAILGAGGQCQSQPHAAWAGPPPWDPGFYLGFYQRLLTALLLLGSNPPSFLPGFLPR